MESADHGATWSQPAEIPIPRARPCVSGRPGITLGDGTILVPYWWDFMFQTGANGMAVIGDIPCVSGTLISKDGGATWQLSTDVYGEWSAQAAGFFVPLELQDSLRFRLFQELAERFKTVIGFAEPGLAAL